MAVNDWVAIPVFDAASRCLGRRTANVSPAVNSPATRSYVLVTISTYRLQYSINIKAVKPIFVSKILKNCRRHYFNCRFC